MPHKIFAPALLAGLFLAGCATPYRQALSPESVGAMSAPSGVVAVSQHEMATSINSSNLAGAAGGGILFALVDAAVNASSAKKTEGFAADLRQALLSFSFEQESARVLKERFGVDAGAPFVLETVVTNQDRTLLDTSTIADESQGDAVLVICPRYFMDPQFSTVVVSLDAVLVAKSPALRSKATEYRYGKAKVPVLYRNGFQTAWALPGNLAPADNKRENNVAAWAADDGAAAKAALLSAIDELTDMVRWDLVQPARTEYKPADKTMRRRIVAYSEGAHFPVDGTLVHTVGGRIWVQTFDGWIHGCR